MPRYMLDTDTCSYIMKRSNDEVLKRLRKVPVSDVCISVVTKAELLFGVEMPARRKQDEEALNAFLRYAGSVFPVGTLVSLPTLWHFNGAGIGFPRTLRRRRVLSRCTYRPTSPAQNRSSPFAVVMVGPKWKDPNNVCLSRLPRDAAFAHRRSRLRKR